MAANRGGRTELGDRPIYQDERATDFAAGRTIPAAPHGQGRRPQPSELSRRLRCCPVAISCAWIVVFSNPRNRKRRTPCHSFASAKSGSTQTFRLRIAVA